MAGTTPEQPPSKVIFTMGLRSNDEFPEPVIAQHVAHQKALAKEAGFDIQPCLVDAHDTPKAVQDIRNAIRSRPQWDGVMIGFGVRGDPAQTPLLELAVNTCIEEVRPTPRFAFNVSPSSTVEALIRVFA